MTHEIDFSEEDTHKYAGIEQDLEMEDRFKQVSILRACIASWFIVKRQSSNR